MSIHFDTWPTNIYKLAHLNQIRYRVFINISPENGKNTLMEAELLLRLENNRVLATCLNNQLWTFTFSQKDTAVAPQPNAKFKLQETHSGILLPEVMLNSTGDSQLPGRHSTISTISPRVLPLSYTALMKALRTLVYFNLSKHSSSPDGGCAESLFLPFGGRCFLPNSCRLLLADPVLNPSGDLLLAMSVSDPVFLRLKDFLGPSAASGGSEDATPAHPRQAMNSLDALTPKSPASDATYATHATNNESATLGGSTPTAPLPDMYKLYLAPSSITARLAEPQLANCLCPPPKNPRVFFFTLELATGLKLSPTGQWVRVVPEVAMPGLGKQPKQPKPPSQGTILWPLDLLFVKLPFRSPSDPSEPREAPLDDGLTWFRMPDVLETVESFVAEAAAKVAAMETEVSDAEGGADAESETEVDAGDEKEPERGRRGTSSAPGSTTDSVLHTPVSGVGGDDGLPEISDGISGAGAVGTAARDPEWGSLDEELFGEVEDEVTEADFNFFDKPETPKPALHLPPIKEEAKEEKTASVVEKSGKAEDLGDSGGAAEVTSGVHDGLSRQSTVTASGMPNDAAQQAEPAVSHVSGSLSAVSKPENISSVLFQLPMEKLTLGTSETSPDTAFGPVAFIPAIRKAIDSKYAEGGKFYVAKSANDDSAASGSGGSAKREFPWLSAENAGGFEDSESESETEAAAEAEETKGAINEASGSQRKRRRHEEAAEAEPLEVTEVGEAETGRTPQLPQLSHFHQPPQKKPKSHAGQPAVASSNSPAHPSHASASALASPSVTPSVNSAPSASPIIPAPPVPTPHTPNSTEASRPSSRTDLQENSLWIKLILYPSVTAGHLVQDFVVPRGSESKEPYDLHGTLNVLLKQIVWDFGLLSSVAPEISHPGLHVPGSSEVEALRRIFSSPQELDLQSFLRLGTGKVDDTNPQNRNPATSVAVSGKSAVSPFPGANTPHSFSETAEIFELASGSAASGSKSGQQGGLARMTGSTETGGSALAFGSSPGSASASTSVSASVSLPSAAASSSAPAPASASASEPSLPVSPSFPSTSHNSSASQLIFPIAEPEVVVRRADQILRLSIHAAKFWKLLGLSPVSGQKDVLLLHVYPDSPGVEAAARVFMETVSAFYYGCNLGTAEYFRCDGESGVGVSGVSGAARSNQRRRVPNEQIVRIVDGMMPYACSGNATNIEQIVASIGQTLAKVARAVAAVDRAGGLTGGSAGNKTVVVLVADPFRDVAHLWDVAKAVKDCQRGLSGANCVFQLVPVEFYATAGTVAMPSQSRLVAFARGLYERVPSGPQFDGDSDDAYPGLGRCVAGADGPRGAAGLAGGSDGGAVFSPAGPLTLDRNLPSLRVARELPRGAADVPFRLAAEGDPRVYLDGSFLHVAYGLSRDRKWLVAAWSDELGRVCRTEAFSTVQFRRLGGAAGAGGAGAVGGVGTVSGVGPETVPAGRTRSRVFEDICSHIWDVTVALVNTLAPAAAWQVTLARQEPMEEEEIGMWQEIIGSSGAEGGNAELSDLEVTFLYTEARPGLALGDAEGVARAAEEAGKAGSARERLVDLTDNFYGVVNPVKGPIVGAAARVALMTGYLVKNEFAMRGNEGEESGAGGEGGGEESEGSGISGGKVPKLNSVGARCFEVSVLLVWSAKAAAEAPLGLEMSGPIAAPVGGTAPLGTGRRGPQLEENLRKILRQFRRLAAVGTYTGVSEAGSAVSVIPWHVLAVVKCLQVLNHLTVD